MAEIKIIRAGCFEHPNPQVDSTCQRVGCGKRSDCLWTMTPEEIRARGAQQGSDVTLRRKLLVSRKS